MSDDFNEKVQQFTALGKELWSDSIGSGRDRDKVRRAAFEIVENAEFFVAWNGRIFRDKSVIQIAREFEEASKSEQGPLRNHYALGFGAIVDEKSRKQFLGHVDALRTWRKEGEDLQKELFRTRKRYGEELARVGKRIMEGCNFHDKDNYDNYTREYVTDLHIAQASMENAERSLAEHEKAKP